jgi:hypothetical protein
MQTHARLVGLRRTRSARRRSPTRSTPETPASRRRRRSASRNPPRRARPRQSADAAHGRASYDDSGQRACERVAALGAARTNIRPTRRTRREPAVIVHAAIEKRERRLDRGIGGGAACAEGERVDGGSIDRCLRVRGGRVRPHVLGGRDRATARSARETQRDRGDESHSYGLAAFAAGARRRALCSS